VFKLKKCCSLGIEDRGPQEQMLKTILPNVIREKEGKYFLHLHWQKGLLLVT